MELHDNKMKELLSYSKLELPFADFEENMLQKIEEYELKKNAAERNKFFGHICFLAGIVFGILLNYLISKNVNELVNNIELQDKIILGVQLFYAVMIVLFAFKLWDLSKMNLRDLFK